MLPFQIGVPDFVLLFGGLSVAVTALHLLHRRHVRRVVSSLQFWSEGAAVANVRRARFDQPWSLVLQLLALAMLMLALTELPWMRVQPRRHLLVLDTSARAEKVFGREKEQIRRYLRHVPAGDQLQLVEADGLAAPVTGFTDDHSEIEAALTHATTRGAALNWNVVSTYADAALHADPVRPGDLVYFGPGVANSLVSVNGTCENGTKTTRVGVVSERASLWAAALRAMPGFVYGDVRTADILIYDRAGHIQGDPRPALFVDPPAGTAVPGTDAVLGFDPFAGGARFDSHSAIALLDAMDRLAGSGGSARTLPAGLIEIPLNGAETGPGVELISASEPVPFNLRENAVSAYVDHPGLLILRTADRLTNLCLTSVPPAIGLNTPPFPHESHPFAAWWRVFALGAAVLLALEWWLFARHSHALMLLKAAGIAVILLSVCGLVVRFGSRPTALLLLVDHSSSMGKEAADNAANYAEHSQAARTDTFGAASTNIEAALMSAVAHAPEGTSPRVRVLSDGNETEGSAMRAAVALARGGIPVDTVPLGGGSGPVHIKSVRLPQSTYSGEAFPVAVSIDCKRAQRVDLRLFARNTEIGRSAFFCNAGANSVELQARIRGAGAMAVSAVAGRSKFDQAILVNTPRVLLVSADRTGEDANLASALRSSGFTIIRADWFPTELGSFDLVIASNIDMEALPEDDQIRLERFIDRGGGLLSISGEHQVYHETKTLNTMDRMLPALVRPPETPDGISVVLVIDKSSSMEGRKIQLARLSASAVVDHLRPADTIGILIFDNAYAWVAPPRRATDKAGIKRLIAGITPDGGTQIPAAVEEAYRRILKTQGTYKHIVLLTDGISEEGDSLLLAQDAAAHQVTISTIGLGQDVNKPYLEKLAEASGGQSYFLDDPSRLRELLLKDIAKVQAKTAVEARVTISRDDVAVLRDVDFQHAPALRGYVRYEPRSGAHLLLSAAGRQHDPLLTEWAYGLGHVAIFASDAKSRWASDWIGWKGFDPFWTSVALRLVRRGSAGDMRLQLHENSNQLVADYTGAQAPERCYYFGPGGARGILHWTRSSTGYEAKTQVRWSPGLWIVRPEHEPSLTPQAAFLARDSESQGSGVNEHLLRNLASITGGVYNPRPEYVPPVRRGARNIQLWPLLLWVAIALMMVELAARKLRQAR